MAVLSAETELFPGDLLEAGPDLAGEQELADACDGADAETGTDYARRWRVVYTRSRQEKSLARHLVAHEVPFYLPLIKQKKHRRTASRLPLFTGYLFMHCDAEERVTALTSNRISQILDVEDQATLITDLRQIHTLIHADAPLTIEQRLQPGRKVRVKDGVLAGLEGTIVSRRTDSRLLVAVNYLNQGVSIQIDDFMVEPL